MPAKGSAGPQRRRRPAEQARRELLDGAVAYASANGLASFTLRGCAEALQTSHRMLIHHFGSKEHLVAAVMAELREQQLQRVASEVASGAASATEAGDVLWAAISSDPDALRRNLQLVGLALLDPERYGDIVTASVKQWIDGTSMLLPTSLEESERQAIATAVVAMVGGLQIDLLLSGESARVRAAYEAMQRIVGIALATKS